MKKLFFCVLVIFLLFAGAAHAASLLGPAEPDAAAGKFSSGVGYFYYDDKWKNGGSFNIIQHQAFLEGSYGLYRGMELFLRFGGTDVDLSDDLSFKDNYRPYGGIGVRGVFYRPDPQFAIGATLYVDSVLGDFKQTNVLGPANGQTTKLEAPWSATFALLGEWTPY